MAIVDYQVKYDPVLQRRLEFAYVRDRWKEWVKYLINLGGRGVLFSFVFWIVYSLDTDISNSGLLRGVIAGFFISVLAGIAQLLKDLQLKRFNERAEMSWNCTIQNEGWTYTDNFGVSRTYPWNEMKLLFVHNYAWLISIRGESIWVYRAPLRECGFEQYFEDKLIDNLQ